MLRWQVSGTVCGRLPFFIAVYRPVERAAAAELPLKTLLRCQASFLPSLHWSPPLPEKREDCPRGGRTAREKGGLPERRENCLRRRGTAGGERALPEEREHCPRRGSTAQEEGGLPEKREDCPRGEEGGLPERREVCLRGGRTSQEEGGLLEKREDCPRGGRNAREEGGQSEKREVCPLPFPINSMYLRISLPGSFLSSFPCLFSLSFSLS